MKLKINKGQEGLEFAGIKNGKYTNEYSNAVNSILNNPSLYKKVTNGLNIENQDQFKKLAYDYNVGPVHKNIIDVQKSTTFLPKNNIKYKNNIGTTVRATSNQFISGNKEAFDQQLTTFNNDSTKAYNTLLKSFPNQIIKETGKQSSIKTPTEIQNNSFLKNYYSVNKNPAYYQTGGLITTLTYKKDITPLKPTQSEIFNDSKYNFLNLPKQPNIFNILNMGNTGYNKEEVFKLIDTFEGFKDKVYKDGKGIDTIGHGLTDKSYIKKGSITKEESLKGVETHIEKEVLPHLKSKPYWSKLNDNQKSALISYVYNIGSGNFNVKSPSLQKALSNGNWKEAAKQMDFGYNDKNNPGLKERRDQERKLFLN